MKVRWIDKLSSDEILRETRSVWENIVKRRVQLIGHIMHHENLIKSIIEGYIEGKRGRGRPRL